MRLLDSNILIYATDPENEWLRTWFEAEPFSISQISQIEVLGYHQITPEEISDLQEFVYSSNVVPVTDEAAQSRQVSSQHRDQFREVLWIFDIKANRASGVV